MNEALKSTATGYGKYLVTMAESLLTLIRNIDTSIEVACDSDNPRLLKEVLGNINSTLETFNPKDLHSAQILAAIDEFESYESDEIVAPVEAPKPEPVSEPELIQFKVGTVYYERSVGDHNCIYRFKVIGRTAKQVTVRELHGPNSENQDAPIKRGISVYNGKEQFKPFGTYSMCCIISADRIYDPLKVRKDWEK